MRVNRLPECPRAPPPRSQRPNLPQNGPRTRRFLCHHFFPLRDDGIFEFDALIKASEQDNLILTAVISCKISQQTAQCKNRCRREFLPLPPPFSESEWQNPPRDSPNYERVSKAFRCCQDLLRSLVPLPGKPFRKAAGTLAPLFQVKLDAKIGANRA